MSTTTESILREIDAVLSELGSARARANYDDLSDLGAQEQNRIITLAESAIERLSPAGSTYRRQIQSIDNRDRRYPHMVLPVSIGVLEALKFDYMNGYMYTVESLVHATVFNDFLEMAEHLQDQGYKDPAAVLAGSVLEEHLRNLCIRHSIATNKPNGEPKKADSLNADLRNAGIYNVLEQKSITAYLDLRNKAAHGRYSEYTLEQVQEMIRGIRGFMTRNAA